jgi:hypothetical protein
MSVDTIVAQHNVVGRRLYSRLSAHCSHKPWITLFHQRLWIHLLVKVMCWDGAGAQDSLRIANSDHE